VMFDGSRRSYEENVAVTADVVRHCHARNVQVEAELGEVGGKDGVHSSTARTRPEDAAIFVDDTEVDALAVAVGSSHAMTDRSAVLDHTLISDLARAVPVPLVLHGSSGVPDGELAAAVRSGMVKINIGTILNVEYTAAVREALAADDRLVDPRKYLRPARTRIAGTVAHLLDVLSLRTP